MVVYKIAIKLHRERKNPNQPPLNNTPVRTFQKNFPIQEYLYLSVYIKNGILFNILMCLCIYVQCEVYT